MKNIFLIGSVVIALAAVGVVLMLLLGGGEPADTEQPSGTEFPTGSDRPVTPGTGGGGSGSLPVRTESGGSTTVRDFRNDENVEAAPDGSYYILRDTSSPETTMYEILYSSTDGGIIVSLRDEPLSQSRREAENALMQHLNVSHDTLCTLAISVGVAADVNEFYAGQELGISNCPGSQPL